ncbi:hypothetical protein JQ615_41360 [Bradyrhizobium jicamae]|uniref:DUF3291 domain-containing protein n=2 Tax=Bradyrhizobium jicamae TaxID=280332 RepID=A0ABS5FYJ4_9BRAD|nr:hypothetical protein [Bradyrhizobium jicamae]MBR0938972.1 hypothetical protein [Bradyrhizobium jicamae]
MLQLPEFWLLTLRALAQARCAEGCSYVTARAIEGTYHTMTIWTDIGHMRAYVVSGAHKAAIRRFRPLGTGRVYTFQTDSRPTWQEGYELWKQKAREA